MCAWYRVFTIFTERCHGVLVLCFVQNSVPMPRCDLSMVAIYELKCVCAFFKVGATELESQILFCAIFYITQTTERISYIDARDQKELCKLKHMHVLL